MAQILLQTPWLSESRELCHGCRQLGKGVLHDLTRQTPTCQLASHCQDSQLPRYPVMMLFTRQYVQMHVA